MRFISKLNSKIIKFLDVITCWTKISLLKWLIASKIFNYANKYFAEFAMVQTLAEFLLLRVKNERSFLSAH